jgi:hypothetical protein
MKYYYRLKCGKEFRFGEKPNFNEKGNCKIDGEMKKGEYAQGMEWCKVSSVQFYATEISVSWTE